MERKKGRFSDYLILCLLFILNFFLKSYFLTSRDIALDEPFSIFTAQKDIPTIISILITGNNPPLYEIILHFWIKIFGLDPFWIRLPSVLFSALTAGVLYLAGKKFFNTITGLGAGLIFSFSTMHVYFSHEARVYPLFCLLTALSLYYFLSLAADPSKKKYAFLLFAANLLLVYSHYFGLFVVFAELVSLLVIKEKRMMSRKIGVLAGALALLYLPLILVFKHRVEESAHGTWVAAPKVTEYYGNLNRFLNGKYNMLMLLAIAAAGILLLSRNKMLRQKLSEFISGERVRIIFTWFFVPYTVMFAASFSHPMFIDRYILFLSIPLFLFISAMIDSLFLNNIHKTAAMMLLAASMAVTLNLNPDNNRRLKEVANEVTRQKKNGATVLLCPNYMFEGFAYHYNIDYFKKYDQTKDLLMSDGIFPVSNAEEAAKDLDPAAAECVYVQADSQWQDPGGKILQMLRSKFPKHEVKEIFEIYRVHHFSR